MAKSEEYVAKLMESIAVIKVSVGFKRAELVWLHQDHDEPFRTFATRLLSKAETCKFTAVSECECGKKMLQVIKKKQLRRRSFKQLRYLFKSSCEIICFIKTKKMDIHATENFRNVSATDKAIFYIGDKSLCVPCQR